MQQQMTFDMGAQTANAVALNAHVASSEAEDFGIVLTGRARTIFDAMKAIVEAPGCRLNAYKQDFYKYDRARLAATHGTGRYIWVIRENGTHLISIGIHTRNFAEIDAALHAGGNACDIYLIDPARALAQKIDAGKARELGKQLEYVTRNGTVFKADCAIAHFDVTFTAWAHGKPPQGVVLITRTDAPLA